MFADGTRIIPAVSAKSAYTVTKDMLLTPEPATVQVFVDNKDFVDMPRAEILADIIEGATVTSVGYRIASKELITNAINCAAYDLFLTWYEIYLNEKDNVGRSNAFEAFADNVLYKAAGTLAAGGYDTCGYKLKINGCWYPVERYILASIKKAYLHYVGGEKFVF